MQLNNKFVLLIVGETFRGNVETSTSCPSPYNFRGGQGSYSLQFAASFSHYQFVKFMYEHHKMECDIRLVVNNLNSEFDSSFERFYSGTQNTIHWQKRERLGESNIQSIGIDVLRKNIDAYEFALIIRPDLFLKPFFLQSFMPNDKRIIFSHVNEIVSSSSGACFFPNATPHKSNTLPNSDIPAVNHMPLYVPKEFFDVLLSNKLLDGHYSYMRGLELVGKHNMGFMLNTYHSSNSALVWNPIFHQVGRAECLNWGDFNYRVDQKTHNPILTDLGNPYEKITNNDFAYHYSNIINRYFQGKEK